MDIYSVAFSTQISESNFGLPSSSFLVSAPGNEGKRTHSIILKSHSTDMQEQHNSIVSYSHSQPSSSAPAGIFTRP